MYQLLDIKWGDTTQGTPSGTINWEDDLSGLTPASGASVGSLVSALNDAFSAWEDVAALSFQEGGSVIDVSIGYASFSTDGIVGNDGAAATASWTGTQAGSLEPANAEILFNSDLTWAPFGSGGIDFFAVAAHEIGHIIGLGHPLPEGRFPNEIMNSIVSATELGTGDITGAQILYGTDGDDVPIDLADDDPVGGGGVTGDGGGGGASGGGGAIALLLGLLALVSGIFTGGASAAVLAAASVPSMNNDDDDEDDAAEPEQTFTSHGAGCGCAACCGLTTLPDGTEVIMHVTRVPDLPLIDFNTASFDSDDEDDVNSDGADFFV